MNTFFLCVSICSVSSKLHLTIGSCSRFSFPRVKAAGRFTRPIGYPIGRLIRC